MLDPKDPKDYILTLDGGDGPIEGSFASFEEANDPGALDDLARWIEEGAQPGDTLTVGGGAAPLETWTLVRGPTA